MSPWQASLDLRFTRQADSTILHSRHSGPLRVQKALYPEGRETCHAILVHPPGGIAGGDQLSISAEVEPEAHALITTPGAAKWYKSTGQVSRQALQLNIAGACEWLPQESIVYDAAEVDSQLLIDLEPQSAMIGWDIVAMGRRESGERFRQGVFAQSIRLRESGRLLWHERTRIEGGDRMLDSPAGLRGLHVFGCLWAWGPAWSEAQIAAMQGRGGGQPASLCAPAGPSGDRLAARTAHSSAPTLLTPKLLVARALGGTTGAVRSALEPLWRQLRPWVFAGREAATPRIWST